MSSAYGRGTKQKTDVCLHDLPLPCECIVSQPPLVPSSAEGKAPSAEKAHHWPGVILLLLDSLAALGLTNDPPAAASRNGPSWACPPAAAAGAAAEIRMGGLVQVASPAGVGLPERQLRVTAVAEPAAAVAAAAATPTVAAAAVYEFL